MVEMVQNGFTDGYRIAGKFRDTKFSWFSNSYSVHFRALENPGKEIDARLLLGNTIHIDFNQYNKSCKLVGPYQKRVGSHDNEDL